MFKDPIFRHGSEATASDNDDSDISITSTVESNPAEDQTYLVERILAERKIDGETKYLVKWEGYPIERCSWEPLNCFANPKLALSWKKEWPGPEFDWQKWEEDREQDELEREKRKRKRARKRERLGIGAVRTSVSASPPPALRRSQRANRQKQLKAMSKRLREKRGAWSSSSESEFASPSSSDVDEFVVDDGYISLEDSDNQLPDDDSDGQPSRTLRRTSLRRKTASLDDDIADSESDDDEQMDVTKGRRKSRRQPKNKSHDGAKRKTRARDTELHRAKSGIGSDTRRPSVEKSRKSDSNVRKPKTATQGGIKSKTTASENKKLTEPLPSTVTSKQTSPRKAFVKRQVSPAAAQPPKSRVKRQNERSTVPDSSSTATEENDQSRTARRSKPQVPKFYESLATRNLANKPKDRAPPASEAELFRPDEVPKRLSRPSLGAGVPQKRKPSTDEVMEQSASAVTTGLKSALKKPMSRQSSISAQTGATKSTGMEMDVDNEELGNVEPSSQAAQTRTVPPLRLPDFKKLKLDEFRMAQPQKFLAREGVQSAQVSPSAPMMSPGMVSPGTMLSPALSPPGGRNIILQNQPSKMSMLPLAADIVTPTGASIFEARVKFSDRRVDMGTARFEGFSSEFLDLLLQLFPETPTVHISKSLETAYIVKYFVPEMGPPLEHAEVLVNADLCDPFRSSLTLFHGAGVIMHTHFTLLVFLATNDTLRKAFGSIQGHKRAPLRAVAYPPLDRSIVESSSTTGLPALDDGYRHYHPNLYSRIFCLDLAAYNIASANANTVRTCIIYAPPLALLEQTELENVLRMHGVKDIINYTAIPEWVLQTKWPETRVLVHASLRDKLHLLPYIKDLLKVSHGLLQLQWHFFGLIYDPASTPNLHPIIPSRFWSFGTVILITTEFTIRHLDALRTVFGYHRKKIGSTLLCIPSYLVARVEKYMIQHHSTPNTTANDILTLTYELDKKAQTPAHASPGLDGGVIYLPNTDNPGGCEIESLADAFIIFQQANLRYRKFILCHADNEKIASDVYGSISFYNSRSTLFNLGSAPKPDASAGGK